MGVGDATSGYGRGDSLPELVELNREIFFEIAELAFKGGSAVDLSANPPGIRHTVRRGFGYAKAGPVTAEWISPPVPIEETGDGRNTMTAVGVLFERGTSREALLGFFAANNDQLEDDRFDGFSVIDPNRQSGPWLRTYMLDGYVACGRGELGNNKQNDELNKVAGVPLFGKSNINIARKRILTIMNRMHLEVIPPTPDYVSSRGMGDRVG
jgi:hypothetical protein